MKWEYRHISHTASEGLVYKLDVAGREGWETVSVYPAGREIHAILKRPVRPSPSGESK